MRTPLDPPPLETHFFEVFQGGGGGGGGVKNVVKMTPPFFGSKIMNLLVFFDFEPGPDFIGFVWGGVGRALMQFIHFSAIFAMLVVLATSVTPWYPL